MRVIFPSVEIITESNPLKRIELCGRVCYKSEDKITKTSAEKFVERLIKSGHTSVLEHAHLNISGGFSPDVVHQRIMFSPHRYGIVSRLRCTGNGLTLNARDYLLLFPTTRAADFAKMELASSSYMTVRFVCDRAIANELVRHRVFSFSQESTRYVNYKEGVNFVLPTPLPSSAEGTVANCLWKEGIAAAENLYARMIEAGCAPQEARNVLPLSTKTELIMTGTFAQWKEMLKLRTSPGAHPQMRYLMQCLMADEKYPKEMWEEACNE